ncbi:MAG: serine/threonine protein kinase, partial [bacterium]
MSWSGSTESYIPMFDITGERIRGVGILSAMQNANRIILPLSDVRISASIAGQVASVVITQTFQNPYSEHLEATYTFPLPGGAAVSDFEMKVGNRIIRGKVQERSEARRQYQ